MRTFALALNEELAGAPSVRLPPDAELCARVEESNFDTCELVRAPRAAPSCNLAEVYTANCYAIVVSRALWDNASAEVLARVGVLCVLQRRRTERSTEGRFDFACDDDHTGWAVVRSTSPRLCVIVFDPASSQREIFAFKNGTPSQNSWCEEFRQLDLQQEYFSPTDETEQQGD